MQGFLFENPLIPAVVGVVLAGIAIFVWTQTAHKSALYSSLGILVLTIILVTVNVQVQTDRETIRDILHNGATVLRSDEPDEILDFIHPNAVATQRRAEYLLRRLKFEELQVTGIKDISVNPTTTPATAIAEFFARARVKVSTYRGNGAQFIRMYFMRRDGRWLVRDYESYEPTAGFRDNALTQPVL